MFLSPGAFNAFLNHVGQTLSWRRAFACPCINPHSGAADPACPRCYGKRFAWQAPVTGTAGIAGQQLQKRWADFGMWEAGDVVLSVGSDSPLYDMGQYDRITMLNDETPFSVIRIRGQEDILPFAVRSLTRVYWLDDAKAEVEGEIPLVGANGELTWAGGAPPDGKPYSITGTRFSEYFCWGDYPQDRGHHHGFALPKRIVLRRWDLYGRT